MIVRNFLAARGKPADGAKALDESNTTHTATSRTATVLRASWKDSFGHTNVSPAPAWVLQPRSSFKVGWDVFVATLILYCVVAFPFFVGFSVTPDQPLAIFNYVVDCFFGVDIVLNFMTAYTDKETNRLVFDWKLIGLRYGRSWLGVDLVSTVPFDLFLGGTESIALLRILRLARLLKLLRLFRLVRLTKNLEFLQETLSINPSTTRVVSLFLRILYLAHLIACAWFYICSEQKASLHHLRFVDQPLFHVQGPGGQTIHQAPHGQQYLACLYFTLVTMFGVGYGDFLARTTLERGMCVVLMLIGSMSVGLIIGSIAATVDVRHAKYSERLTQVKQYLRDRRFPLALQRKIKRYFHYFLDRKSVFDEHAILNELSPNLRLALVMHCNQDTIKKIDFFKESDMAFVSAVITHLKPMFQLACTSVYNEGEFGTEMYFLVRGVIEVTVDHLTGLDLEMLNNVFSQTQPGSTLASNSSEEGTSHSSPAAAPTSAPPRDIRKQRTVADALNVDSVTVGVFTDGSYFGEASVLIHTPREATLTAIEQSDMYSLGQVALAEVLEEHPAVAESMKKSMEDRMRKFYWAKHSMLVALHRQQLRETKLGNPLGRVAEGSVEGESPIPQEDSGEKREGTETASTGSRPPKLMLPPRPLRRSHGSPLHHPQHALSPPAAGTSSGEGTGSSSPQLLGKRSPGNSPITGALDGNTDMPAMVLTPTAATGHTGGTGSPEERPSRSLRSLVGFRKRRSDVVLMGLSPEPRRVYPFETTGLTRAQVLWTVVRMSLAQIVQMGDSVAAKKPQNKWLFLKSVIATRKTSGVNLEALMSGRFGADSVDGKSVRTADIFYDGAHVKRRSDVVSSKRMPLVDGVNPDEFSRFADKMPLLVVDGALRLMDSLTDRLLMRLDTPAHLIEHRRTTKLGSSGDSVDARGLTRHSSDLASQASLMGTSSLKLTHSAPDMLRSAYGSMKDVLASLSPSRTPARKVQPVDVVPLVTSPALSKSGVRIDGLSALSMDGRSPARSRRSRSPAQRSAASVASSLAEERIAISHGFIMHPSMPSRVAWDVVMALLTVFTVIEVPYRIGFDQEATGTFAIFDRMVDFFFIADVISNFFVGYHDDAGSYVADPTVIRFRYLRSWFGLDLASSVPFDWIVSSVTGGLTSGALRSSKLIRILRLVRLVKLFRLARLARFLGRFDDHVNLSPVYLRIAKLVFQVTFMGHLLACFWMFVSIVDESARLSEITSVNWWRDYGLDGTNVGHLYIASLYYTYYTMATVGFGDIVATNTQERIAALVLLVLGASVFGFIVGSVSQLAAAIATEGLAARSNTKLSDVKSYLRERKIPKELRKRIVQYYELFLSWSESFDEDGVLVDLTENLRREVLLHVHRNIIEKVPFLSTIDPGFMSHVFAIMIPSFALPGEVVVQQGDVARHMYFIIKGTVSEVRYLENGEEEVLGDLGGGDHFGELAILTEEPHAEAVRARRFCKMFLIEKADFDVMLVHHPQMLDALKLSIQGKLQQRMVSPDLPLAYQNHAWVEIQRILAVIDAKAAEKEAASYEMQHRIVSVSMARGASSVKKAGGVRKPARNVPPTPTGGRKAATSRKWISLGEPDATASPARTPVQSSSSTASLSASPAAVPAAAAAGASNLPAHPHAAADKGLHRFNIDAALDSLVSPFSPDSPVPPGFPLRNVAGAAVVRRDGGPLPSSERKSSSALLSSAYVLSPTAGAHQ